MAHTNTPKNLETREIFTPNEWQVRGSVYYVPRPRHPLVRKSPSILFLLILLALIGTYLVVRVFAW